MYKKVIFYNHFGNGDIFESREFVKEYIRKIPSDKYYYAHGKNPRILADMPYLKFTDVVDVMHAMKDITKVNEELYINTWIGRDGRYVLPGIGCVVENLYKMHSHILEKLGLEPLQKNLLDYIPNIDYAYYDTDTVNSFCREYPHRKVLISNGPVHSCQAENFDFNPVIEKVAKTFPDITFIITSPSNIKMDNLFNTGDILKSDYGFDLNEISYLSLFCDTHIGRNSGPHVFAQVLENWQDPEKASLSFTYQEIASHFVFSGSMPMKKYWSSRTDVDGVYEKICEVVERRE